MDPNFRTIEELIRTNPTRANELTAEWYSLVARYPQISSYNNEQFVAWANENGVDPNTRIGRDIANAYSYLTSEAETQPEIQDESHASLFSSLLSLPAIAAIEATRPKKELMEDDNDYKRLSEEKEKEWLNKNPGKDFASKEGIDYLYGSLDYESKPGLLSDTKTAFEEKFEAKSKNYKLKQEKIYPAYQDDPAVKRLFQRIQEHTNARFELFKKENPDITRDAIQQLVEQKEYEWFAAKYKTKAKEYGKIDQKIQSGLDTTETKEQLRLYQESSKKEVKLTEKTHKEYSDKTQEEDASNLSQLLQANHAPEGLYGLVDSRGQPLTTPTLANPSEVMPFSQAEEVSMSPSQPAPSTRTPFLPSPRPMTRSINGLNKFASRFKSPLGLPKAASAISGLGRKAALRGAAMLAGPTVAIVVVVIILLFTLFFVVGDMALPGGSGGTTTLTPTPGVPGSTPTPLPISKNLQTVLSYAALISSFLQKGTYVDPASTTGPFYNKMISTISNGTYTAVQRQGNTPDTSPNGLYWCTDLVIDAYNLAGITGLTNQEAVVTMISFWQTTPGYIYLSYTGSPQILSQVVPGDAMFSEGSGAGNEHVAIVSSISIDSNGNGSIQTYDSNTSSPTHTFYVTSWVIYGTWYPVVGFGTI